MGLAALGLTVVLIFRCWWRVRRATSDPAERAHVTACGMSIVALGAHGLVDMPIMIPAVMLLMLGILAAGIVPTERDTPHPSDDNYPWRRSAALIARFAPLVLWIAVLASGWWSASVYIEYIEGERLVYDGRYVQAADPLRRAAEAQPFIPLYDAEYAYTCGLAAYDGDDTCLPEGIAAYRRALDHEPAHAVWWANLAVLYWQHGQPGEAIELMRRATGYAPDLPDLWLNLGIYYEQQGMADRAADAYRRALDARPCGAMTILVSNQSAAGRVGRSPGQRDTLYARSAAVGPGPTR